jgi:serine/threonine protein kinase/sugar lactone lactonase YvrE
MTPGPGDLLANHRLTDRIGQHGGGGCLLFRAIDLELNRTVVLKLLPTDYARLPRFRARFQREAELAARIYEHRNVVTVFRSGEVAAGMFLTMQYVDGRDLGQIIRSDGPLDLGHTCAIVDQVADALDAAHDAGMVHRDVKPGNIFVTSPTGSLHGPLTALIGDFGLALPLGDDRTVSLGYGTPGYLAPERHAEAPPSVGQDVYGLACVAYACLSGAPPFPGADGDSGRADVPPPLSTRYEHIPPAVDEVLATALSWRPERRHASCGEFVLALREAGGLVHSDPTLPPPDEQATTPGRRTAPRSTLASVAARPWARPAAIAFVALTTTVALVLSGTTAVPGRPVSIEQHRPEPVAKPVGSDISSVALDDHGNLYIADRDENAVRKLTPAGALTTVAGGKRGYGGDGGLADDASLNAPGGLAVDDAGRLYIADTGNGSVRVVQPNGVITTAAQHLDSPVDVAIDPGGGFFVAELTGHRVRHVDTSGAVTTVAGTGLAGFSGDGGPATGAQLSLPTAVTVHAGSLYIVDSDNARIRKVAPDHVITTVAGMDEDTDDDDATAEGDGGPATAAPLEEPTDLAVDDTGALYIADPIDQRVRRVDSSGEITTIAGSGTAGFSGDGGAAVAAQLAFPQAVTTRHGAVYVADVGNQRIRYVGRDGVITTVVGAGAPYPADGGPATAGYLQDPASAEPGPDGALYIADASNHRIRKVDAAGVITTVAGTGVAGDSGDGGPATAARIGEPIGATVDPAGNLYFTDMSNDRVRKVATDGTITTVVGTGREGSEGDGGPANEAEANSPVDLTVGGDGSLYVAELDGHRVRRVDPAGVITTVAGNGTKGFAGDGGPATQAMLYSPTSVDVTADGTLYIADRNNRRVRKVAPDGTITTVAGNGAEGFSGDGGPATAAALDRPVTVSADEAGNVYIADPSAHRIRRVDSDGVITTVFGTGEQGRPTDGQPAAQSPLTAPYEVYVDESGRLFVTDSDNNQIYLVGQDQLVRLVAGKPVVSS